MAAPIRVKRPVITIRLEPNASSSTYSTIAAIVRLQDVLNTLYEKYPDLNIKGVSVS